MPPKLIYLACLISASLAGLCRGAVSDHADATPWGRESATISRVFTAKSKDGEYRSYLVEWNGRPVVVFRHPAYPKPPHEAGEKITFEIIRYNYQSEAPYFLFFEEPNEVFLSKLHDASRPNSPPEPNSKEILIEIDAYGRLKVDQVPCKIGKLTETLKKTSTTDVLITLKAHPESNYRTTTEVLETLKRGAFKNVTFTSDPEVR